LNPILFDMANGPLTPPPTTAAELQDEARNVNAGGEPVVPQALVTVPVTAQTTQDRQDAYQHIFPTIADFASQSNFEGLIHAAENGDLNVQISQLLGLLTLR
jgi:COP9 signalosome complex subunit 8